MAKLNSGQSSPARRMNGKRAIVIGNCRNVGRIIAKLFAAEGPTVAIVGLDVGRGRATLDSLEHVKPDLGQLTKCNAISERSVKAIVTQAHDAFGGIGVPVNGVTSTDRLTTLLELTATRWDAFILKSLKSVFSCPKYLSQFMVKQRSGYIGSTPGLAPAETQLRTTSPKLQW